MNIRRLHASFSVEFWHSFRRPLFFMLAVVIILTAFGLASGHMQISSGETSVGGKRAWITSEFAQTQTMTYLVLLYYAFFIAVARSPSFSGSWAEQKMETSAAVAFGARASASTTVAIE